MPRTKISEFSATPANNTDIDSINIAEGCAPSGINDAIRELMAQLKDFQTGAVGDSFNGPVGSSTAAAGAFTTLSASGTTTLSGLTASTTLALDASKNVVSVTNTGTGSNVLATSPTLVTPALGTPSALVGTNITGTATSFNINGTVGATTANTGAFTTLAASGAVTLSGGTANGVTYLNGSKVLTSGSALQFDGTGLGVGTSASAYPLTVQANVNTQGFKLVGRASDNLANVSFTANNGSTEYAFINTGATYFSLGVGGSENFRATSSSLYTASGINVGIGTSSPAAKLDVLTSASGNVAIFKSSSTYANIVANNGSSTGGGVFTAYQNGTQSSLFGVEGGILGTTSKDTAIFNDVAGGSINLYTAGSATLRFSVNSVGGVKAHNTIGVGNATPSTSGAGITFPATQSASSDANTLDDYEEGTWSIVDQSGAGLTFTVNGNQYTKVGRAVTVNLEIVWPVTVDTSNAAASLPITAIGSNRGGLTAFSNNGISTSVYINGGSNTFYLYGNTGATITNAAMSGKYLIVSITYFV
jgi:hypothetical protein